MAIYRRRPIEVQAQRVKKRNIVALKNWCGGQIILDGRTYHAIQVPIGGGGKKAMQCAVIGSWIIQHEGGHFSVEPDVVFRVKYQLLK